MELKIKIDDELIIDSVKSAQKFTAKSSVETERLIDLIIRDLKPKMETYKFIRKMVAIGIQRGISAGALEGDVEAKGIYIKRSDRKGENYEK